MFKLIFIISFIGGGVCGFLLRIFYVKTIKSYLFPSEFKLKEVSYVRNFKNKK